MGIRLWIRWFLIGEYIFVGLKGGGMLTRGSNGRETREGFLNWLNDIGRRD